MQATPRIDEGSLVPFETDDGMAPADLLNKTAATGMALKSVYGQDSGPNRTCMVYHEEPAGEESRIRPITFTRENKGDGAAIEGRA